MKFDFPFRIFHCLVFLVLFGSACSPQVGEFAAPSANRTDNAEEDFSNYLVIANSGNKSVNLYDPDFRFVRTLVTLVGTEVPASLATYDSQSILLAIEGGTSYPDRVVKIALGESNNVENYIFDPTNFTGTSIKGIARLVGGAVIASDSSTIANQMERYQEDIDGFARRFTLGWPQALQATTTMIFPGPTGNFVQCSAGSSDLVRTYLNTGGAAAYTGTASATTAPSLGSAHDVNGCVFDSNGRVAALFNGTNDSLRVYTDATLSSVAWTFTNSTRFANPQALAVRPNGNFLVAEFVTPRDYIIEIDADGNYVSTSALDSTSTITAMLVIP